MTNLYITIDTEYSAGLAIRDGLDCRRQNFERSIIGRTPQGDVGIAYQMDVFDRCGLKGVFFIDPMPALVWGTEAIADIVGPIVERGHDVQLHIHTEWLEIAGQANPLKQRVGTNIKDFSFDEQCVLLDYARSILIAAGAPAPIAFRAGNFGADDNTLRALLELGFTHETSHCPGIPESACAISLSSDDRLPMLHCGVIEVPVGSIANFNGGLRHAQVTALSAQEMLASVRHAKAHGTSAFTLVSHSFELLSRDRTRINQIIKQRFEHFCSALAANGFASATYTDSPPCVASAEETNAVLPHNIWRSARRLAEQALGNSLYGGR